MIKSYKYMSRPEVDDFSGSHFRTVFNWCHKLKNLGWARKSASGDWEIHPFVAVLIRARNGKRGRFYVDDDQIMKVIELWVGGLDVDEIGAELGINVSNVGLQRLDRDEIEAFLKEREVGNENGSD